MLKLCTLTSPGKRIKNIVGLVTLMSHVGHERTTRDNNLCQSSLPQSLSVSQWRAGEMSRKGTSQCNQWVLVRSSPHRAGLDSVKLKADKVSSCKKTVFNFLRPKTYLFNGFIWLQSNVWYICIHH